MGQATCLSRVMCSLGRELGQMFQRCRWVLGFVKTIFWELRCRIALKSCVVTIGTTAEALDREFLRRDPGPPFCIHSSAHCHLAPSRGSGTRV